MPTILAFDHIYVRYLVLVNLIAKKYILLLFREALQAPDYFSHSLSTVIRSPIHKEKMHVRPRNLPQPLPIGLADFAHPALSLGKSPYPER